MKTPADYIDGALKRMDLASDSAIARILKIQPSSISLWRSGKSLPTNENLLVLADLAGFDADEALFCAAYWRCDEDTRRVLLKRIKAAVALLFCVASMVLSSPAQANISGTMHHDLSRNIYYHTFRKIVARLKRLLFHGYPLVLTEL